MLYQCFCFLLFCGFIVEFQNEIVWGLQEDNYRVGIIGDVYDNFVLIYIDVDILVVGVIDGIWSVLGIMFME